MTFHSITIHGDGVVLVREERDLKYTLKQKIYK